MNYFNNEDEYYDYLLHALSNQNSGSYNANPMDTNKNSIPNISNYSKGGIVKKGKKSTLPILAQKIRKKGKDGDTVLAHINPIEAELLRQYSGNGTINPTTGLPQFSFWKKPFKAMRGAVKSMGGGIGGAILGNMLLPGVGTLLGGALGSGASAAIQKKKILPAMLQGALTGAVLPGASSLVGQGAGKLGMNTVSSALNKFSQANVLPAFLSGATKAASTIPGVSTASKVLPALNMTNNGQNVQPYGGYEFSPKDIEHARRMQLMGLIDKNVYIPDVPKQSFTDKLWSGTTDFLTEPRNLLTLGSMGLQFANRPKLPKEKTPEQLAIEQRRFRTASRLSPQELADEEQQLIALAQMEGKVKKKKKEASEEKIGDILVNAPSIYPKMNTPEEYARTGRWITYYSDPQMTKPINMKEGGIVKSKPNVTMEEIHITVPNKLSSMLSGLIGGIGDGQEDNIPANLSSNEYVVPADVVAHLGNGNSENGGRVFDILIANIRKHKTRNDVRLPPKSKEITQYFPKEAKSMLANILR